MSDVPHYHSIFYFNCYKNSASATRNKTNYNQRTELTSQGTPQNATRIVRNLKHDLECFVLYGCLFPA